MRIALLVFALSLGSLVLWPSLPSYSALAAVAAVAVYLLFLIIKQRCYRFVAQILLALVSGGLIAGLNGHLAMARLLPVTCSHQTFEFTGLVVDLPQYSTVRDENLTRFRLQVQDLEQAAIAACPSLVKIIGSDIQLSWYAVPVEVVPGQVWQFQAKLVRPRGQANPFASDYQLSLMINGIVASGTVKTGTYIGQASAVFSELRFRWRNYLLTRSQSDKRQWSGVSEILVALTIGDSRSLPRSSRALLQRTGTSHLMAISGLHVGVVALYGYWLGRLLGALVLVLSFKASVYQMNARLIASLMSLCCAACYAGLSGFALPTQRALIMLALFLLSKIVAKHWSLFDVWLYALVIVLLVDPLQAADGGFYLSFVAVLILILAMSLRHFINAGFGHWLQVWIRPQWAIFIGLIPLSIHMFGGISLVSILANSMAIPWVSVSSVPFSLVGFFAWSIDPQWAEWFLFVASWSLRGLLYFLTLIDSTFSDIGWLTIAISRSLLLVLAATTLVFLLPAPVTLKASLMLLLGTIGLMDFQLNKVIFSAERRVTIFDVGQGLAVLVEADGQRLLYDTGPPFGPNTDAFAKILWPYFRSQGNSTLKALVVSHNDADHAGGVASLAERMNVDHIYAGDPSGLAQRLEPQAWPIKSCNVDRETHAIGVDGRFNFSVGGAAARGNDASCVMLVEFPELQMLLPGDISDEREANLLIPQASSASPLRLLLIPHHGSRSSSSYALLQQFKPDLAVVSAGFRSRYGHPHQEVLARLQSLGVGFVNTADAGAIQLRWYPGQPVRIYRWRETEKHFWFDS